MIDNARTGAYIAHLRQKVGMTQSQLAAMLNVTHQAVSKWENGSALPDLQTMLDLSAVFGVTIEQLLTVPEDIAENASVLPTEAQLDRAMERIEEEIDLAREEEKQMPEEETPEEKEEAPKGSLHLDWGHIIALAPFLGREALLRIVENAEGEMSVGHLAALAPFLPPKMIGTWTKNFATGFMKNKKNGRNGFHIDLSGAMEAMANAKEAVNAVQHSFGSAAKPSSAKEEHWDMIERLMDDGHWDAVGEFIDRLNSGKRKKVMCRAAEDEEWGFVDEHFDRSNSETQKMVMTAACEAENWVLAEKHFDHCNSETRAEIIRSAMENDAWNLLECCFDKLNSSLRAQIIEYAIEEDEWDFAKRHFDQLTDMAQ